MVQNFLRRKCASNPGDGKGWADLRSGARAGQITVETWLRGFLLQRGGYARRALGDETPTIISISKPMSVCASVCVSHGTPAG